MTSGHPIQVLLVEDDPAHAEIIKRNFADFRIANDLQHVEDGQEALDCLQRAGRFAGSASPRPQLVLLDLRLPRIDGLEVLRQIKQDPELKHIAVVVLTTSTQGTDIEKAYKLGANSYLSKPFAFTDFSEMLRATGFFWLIWNQFDA